MTTIPQSSTTSSFTVHVTADARRTVTVSSDGSVLRLVVRTDGADVIDALLGVECDGEVLGAGSTLIATQEAGIVEHYTAYVGKATGVREVSQHETTLGLRSPSGRRWELIVRTAADGVAFRYGLPDDTNKVELGAEHTVLRLPSAARLWTLEYQTWYETERFGADLAELAEGDYGFPTLVTLGPDSWVLLSESDIDGRSSGAHLLRAAEDRPGALRVVTADAALPVHAGHRTPWRVVYAGTLAEIVASHLVDDLAPAADPAVPVVARPGRGGWSWWSSQYSGAYQDQQERFADFAADQGWEHVLVDCGWDAAWVPDLVAHAGRRGIQVHLWSSWSDLDGPEALRKLSLWKSWGVAGIKVDFMESESRERYRWYDAIIAEAERVGLMLNFHGSVIPRGWARTHPNVISYEGIRGAEYYVFYGTPLTAAHNVIQPFTRNVVGSMDYTPVAFSAPGRETSDAHELALSVVYESGITHFADDPEQYLLRPVAARFLATLPPSWEETRLLGGHPDRHALIARRHGDVWFIGAIAAGEPGEIVLDPAELIQDGTGLLIQDAPAGGLEERPLDAANGPVTVRIARNGGFVAVLAPRSREIAPAAPRPTAPPVSIEPAAALADRTEGTLVTIEPGARPVVAPGWSVEPAADGRWRVRPPADAAPGAIGVVSAVRDGDGDVPVIGHARLFVPLGPGLHALSALPCLTARNAVGPVERDQSNGGGDPNDGRPMSVAGLGFARGFGVADESSIEFFLGGQGGTLTLSVGIDDETPDGAALASVVVDGTVVETVPVRGGAAPHEVVVDLARASVLALRTGPDPAAGSPGHVDWIDPRITLGD